MTRILVIDDNADIRRMIVRALDRQGMETLAVSTTAEALWTLLSREFDVVLLDIVLGDENGWETLVRLREFTQTPVVMMSGGGVDRDVRLDAASLGAQGVMQKPFTGEELLAGIEEALKSRKKR